MEELKLCPFCGEKAELYIEFEPDVGAGYSGYSVRCRSCFARTGIYTSEQAAVHIWNRRAEPENEPLTLDKLRKMETPQPLWLEEPPHGDMTESRIEPVLFNGICCGKEERACWVTNNAHRANARTDVILAGKINFYTRKPEGSENNGSIN